MGNGIFWDMEPVGQPEAGAPGVLRVRGNAHRANGDMITLPASEGSWCCLRIITYPLAH